MVYRYTKSHSASSIRLIHLLPGSISTPVRAHLVAHQLRDTCPYETFSYVCGEPDLGEKLLVREHQLKISKRLHTIILQLRLTDSPRNLWIDAICINQYD